MEKTTFNNEYFLNKIQGMRQRLHTMKGFKPVEKISENISEKESNDNMAFVKVNEKVNS